MTCIYLYASMPPPNEGADTPFPSPRRAHRHRKLPSDPRRSQAYKEEVEDRRPLKKKHRSSPRRHSPPLTQSSHNGHGLMPACPSFCPCACLRACLEAWDEPKDCGNAKKWPFLQILPLLHFVSLFKKKVSSVGRDRDFINPHD